MPRVKKEIRILKAKYTIPGHPIAFAGVEKIFNYFKGKLTREEIENFLKAVDVFTVHRQHRASKVFNPTYCYHPREALQADLCSFWNQEKFNKGYRYQLVIIDVFTRFAWVRPLKTKTAKETLATFSKVFEEEIQSARKLVVDSGTEFLNKEFLAWLASKSIQLHIPKALAKASFAEAFIKTLKSLISRYCTEYGTKTFVDALPKLVATYNKRIHRGIQATPEKAEKDQKTQLMIRELNLMRYASIKKKKPTFWVHQVVRISRDLGKFKRSFNAGFTNELFIVKEVVDRMPIPLYLITDLSGKDIDGKFRRSELTGMKFSLRLHIDKILSKDGDFWTVTFQGDPKSLRYKLQRKNFASS